MMKNVHIFSCYITESNGKRRISEYRCSGNVDDDGCFKLKGCCGHIYPTEVVKVTNNRELPTNDRNTAQEESYVG